MSIDPEFAKLLNLPRTSPSFVLRLAPNADQVTVHNPKVVPDDGCDYYVAATTTLNCGRTLPTVVLVWPGGETGKFYWFVDNRWITSDDSETPAALGLSKDQIFPFAWKYAVPLKTDPYHD